MELDGDGISIFADTPYVHSQNGQTYRSFDMTRDGFTILALSFTGKKALRFKLNTLTPRRPYSAFLSPPLW